MKQFLKEMFAEKGTEKISMVRVLVFFVVTVYLINWTWANISMAKFHPIDFGGVAMIVGVLIAKGLNKFGEKGG